MLAIAILAVICGTIYQFTGTVLRTASISTRLEAQEQSFAGLRRLFDAQFAALPANENNVFIGMTKVDNKDHRDAMQLVCPAGNAVLTPDARGLYRVTVGLDETPQGSGHYALVMEREPWSGTEDEEEAADTTFHLPAVSAGGFKTASNQLPSDSVRLLDKVRSLEIAYYDPRLNSWQDKWNDDSMVPSLVRVRLTMENSGAPYEFVEQIPGGGIRRGLPNTVSVPGYPVPGMTGKSNGTVPGTNGMVPNLPSGLTVPPPPPGGFPTVPNLPSIPPNFSNPPVRNTNGVTPR